VTEYAVYQNPGVVDFLMVCKRLPEDQVEQYEAFTGVTFDPQRVAAEASLQPGLSWVMTFDGEPEVIAGYYEIRKGVWQDWLFSGSRAWEPAHWKAVTRRCRRGMDGMLLSSAHRLQCVSLASRIHAHRWYRTLGLELEGTLRGYGANGEDALMFSRLRVE
jgi:hypothetical protein